MPPITKAIILAAGDGTRLMPLTTKVPKPLMDIAGQPLMLRTMQHLKDHGIEEFVIVINPSHEYVFKELLPVNELSITFTYQEKATGMTDAIITAKEHVSGNFVICAGDMVVPQGHVGDMMSSHAVESPFATLSLFQSPMPHLPGLGNVKVEAGRVTAIIEKPAPEQVLSNVYSLPFYVFNESLFAYLEKCPVSSRGEKELQDAIKMAINDGKVVLGSMMEGIPSDERSFTKELSKLHVTSVEDYFTINMEEIAAGGIEKPIDVLCTMIEPVMVGTGCDVADDALLGPGAIIASGTTVGPLAEISNAIVQPGAKIGKQALVEHAIIMAGVSIPEKAVIRGKPGSILVKS